MRVCKRLESPAVLHRAACAGSISYKIAPRAAG
jgi:hypothetical protein